jgi:signal transduction histidine kinase
VSGVRIVNSVPSIGSEHSQNDLFTPFMQEDPLASGSGLGLSIVRHCRELNTESDDEVSDAPESG